MAISLDVIVVGGGICGLAVAVGLKKAGHNVTIYERYPEDIEPGAGIVISANAIRVIRQWGLEPDAYGMTKYVKAFLVNGKTAEIIKPRDISENERVGEFRRMTVRRDLRDMLRDEIERPRKQGEGIVTIVYNTKIQDYDPVRPAVKLPDGTWQKADLVVACNGIKSSAANYIVGEASPAKPTGNSAFRLALPTSQMEESQIVRDALRTKPETAWFCKDDCNRVLVWWPAHFDQVQCFDIVIPDNEQYASTEQWLSKCDKTILLKEFADWHPVFRDILDLADDPLLWKVCAREPPSKLHHEKLVILGDAMHAMPPYRAQGGTMAIEDAGTLEICLSNIEDISELPQRLKLLEELRIPRVTAAQLSSNLRFDLRDEDKAWMDLFERLKTFLRKDEHHYLTSFASFTDWLLKYDARYEAKRALEGMSEK